MKSVSFSGKDVESGKIGVLFYSRPDSSFLGSI